MIDLEKKVGTEVISDEDYATGIMALIKNLIKDLVLYLKDENRKFGIVNSYLSSIFDSYKLLPKFNDDITEKIIFLYKPVILSEFKRLKQRKLSKADCLIVMIRDILNILITEKGNYSGIKEVKSIKKIFNRLFDNIRNDYKENPLYILDNSFKEFLYKKLIGKMRYTGFSIKNEDEKRKEKTILEGSGIRIESIGESRISEISWTDDK